MTKYMLEALEHKASNLSRQQHMAGTANHPRFRPRNISDMQSLEFEFGFETNELAKPAPLVDMLLGKDQAYLISEDHFFNGYMWSLSITKDHFVGVSWRVVVNGQEVDIHREVEVAAVYEVGIESQSKGLTHIRSYPSPQFIPRNHIWGWSNFFGTDAASNGKAALEKVHRCWWKGSFALYVKLLRVVSACMPSFLWARLTSASRKLHVRMHHVRKSC